MPDMRRCLDRGATQVQRYLPRHEGGEFAHGARCGVMKAERHAAKATAAGPARRLIIPARKAAHSVWDTSYLYGTGTGTPSSFGGEEVMA